MDEKKREFLTRMKFSIVKGKGNEEFIKLVPKSNNWKKVIHEGIYSLHFRLTAEILPLMRTMFFDESMIKGFLGKEEPLKRSDLLQPFPSEYEYQVAVLARNIVNQKPYESQFIL